MIYNKKIDFFLIQFPIFFPFLYAVALLFSKNSSFENYLIILTILLLAEPHFGATWTIFFDKRNQQYFKKNKHQFYTGSFIVALFSICGFFLFKSFFLLIFFGFNLFHVTRQSVGICKIYNQDKHYNTFQNSTIYFFNLIFFIIGILRFYIPLINEKIKFILSILIILIIILIFLYELIKYKKLKNAFTTLTGSIIFFPICFVDNPVHAILMGVTMHYTQYIAITAKVYFGRRNILNIFKKENFAKFFKTRYFFTVLIYGVIMTVLAISPKASGGQVLQNLIIIPILGQMLHFYLDSYLWKFSEAHNRDITLKHLKEVIG